MNQRLLVRSLILLPLLLVASLPAGAQPLPPAQPLPTAEELRAASPMRSDELTFPVREFTFISKLLQQETPQEIEVTLPADVLFDFDKADLKPAARETLRELAEIIRRQARGTITIRGHTDSMGSDQLNQRLSERRANAVRGWLVQRERLPAASFSTAGFGARQPVAANRNPDGSDNPEGRQLNRRVTIVIRK